MRKIEQEDRLMREMQQLLELDTYIENLEAMKKFIFLGKLQEVIEQAEKVRGQLTKKAPTRLAVRNEMILLNAYRYKGDFKKAMVCATYALDWALEKDWHDLYMETLVATIPIYIQIQEYKKAEELLNFIEEVAVFETHQNQLYKAQAWGNLYLEKDYEEKAMHAIQSAYEKLDYIEDVYEAKQVEAELLCLRARIYIKRALWMQAEKDLQRAMTLAEEGKLVFIEAQAQLVKLIFTKSQQLPLTEEVLQHVLDVVTKSQSRYLLNEMNKQYLIEAKAQGHWEKACGFLEEIQAYENLLKQDKMMMLAEGLQRQAVKTQAQNYQALDKQILQLGEFAKACSQGLTRQSISEVIYPEIAKLLQVESIGIAYVKAGKMQYEVYNEGQWLAENNDLVRYTMRLAEHSMTFQQTICINDGNFDAYSLKTIRESESQKQLQSNITLCLKTGEEVVGVLILNSYKKNAYTENDLSMAKLIAHYVSMALRQALYAQEVQFLAEHEHLTRILHRGAALKYGEILFKQNHKKHQQTAVILLEVDHFRGLNSKYGYQLSDQILKKIGHILLEATPEKGYVGHYMGEEFLIIIGESSYKEAVNVAECIKKQLANECFKVDKLDKEKDIQVTLSGGVYICDEYTLNFKDAIRFADHALYRARLLGKNRIISYSLKE